MPPLNGGGNEKGLEGHRRVGLTQGTGYASWGAPAEGKPCERPGGWRGQNIRGHPDQPVEPELESQGDGAGKEALGLWLGRDTGRRKDLTPGPREHQGRDLFGSGQVNRQSLSSSPAWGRAAGFPAPPILRPLRQGLSLFHLTKEERSYFLDSFPLDAVRNCHKRDSLKQHKCILLQFWRSEVERKSRCPQD